jgi:indolepyruvate ferredoxin oxidoreductase beta subunit
VNTQQILPRPVITGKQPYPQDIVSSLKVRGINVVAGDALAGAQKAGNAKAVNTVMLGMLANIMDIEESVWLDALKECVPEKLMDVNLKAFKAGRE